MDVTTAVRALLDLQKEHGNLQLVDPDGDIIEFRFIQASDGEYDFPVDVILVTYVTD